MDSYLSGPAQTETFPACYHLNENKTFCTFMTNVDERENKRLVVNNIIIQIRKSSWLD